MSLVQEKVQARLGCKREGSQAGGRRALGVGPGGNCWGLTRFTEGANINGVAQGVVYI